MESVTPNPLQPHANLGEGGSTSASKDNQQVGIRWQNRAGVTQFQLMWLVLFIAAVLLFFVVGFINVSSKNMAVVPRALDCPDGYSRRDDDFGDDAIKSRFCVKAEVKDLWKSCIESLGDVPKEIKNWETVAFKDEENRLDMWEVMGKHPEMPSITIPCILLVSVGWFFALKNYPFTVVYSTIGIGIVGLIIVAFLFKDGGMAAVASPLVMAVIIAVATFVCRKHIDFTCRTISAACKILKNRPHIFTACMILKLCWVAVFSILIWFLHSNAHVVMVVLRKIEVGPSRTDVSLCDFEPKNSTLSSLQSFCFLWIIAWFDMAATLVCAVSMGSEYFHRQDGLAPPLPALTALQWAFTSSAGAIAEGSIVVNLNYYASRYATLNGRTAYCICNPLWWALWLIYKLFQAAINTFSRFAVIMHGFHSGGMFTENVGRPPFEILIKHLGTTLVNGVVGEKVLTASAGLVASLVGIGSWQWLLAAEGIYFFAQIPGSSIFLIVIGFFLAIWYYHKWVLVGLILLSLFRDRIPQMAVPIVSCTLAGLLNGCLCMIILQFFVDVVFHSTDGLIYSYVLEAESGKRVDTGEMKELHDLIQEIKVNNAEVEAPRPDEELELPAVSVGDNKLKEPLNPNPAQVDASSNGPPAFETTTPSPAQQEMADQSVV